MLNNLLLYRLAIINLAGVAFIAYAHVNGWVSRVVEGDSTGLIWLVVAFFLIFMVSLFRRAVKVSAILNVQKTRPKTGPRDSREKFLEKGAHLDDMPGWIMLIGLLGNVLGIMMAISAANLADGGAESITDLLGSMDIAFSATLASGVLGLWADINRRVLKTATVLMLEDAKP